MVRVISYSSYITLLSLAQSGLPILPTSDISGRKGAKSLTMSSSSQIFAQIDGVEKSLKALSKIVVEDEHARKKLHGII